jgi:hypothetical protein
MEDDNREWREKQEHDYKIRHKELEARASQLHELL